MHGILACKPIRLFGFVLLLSALPFLTGCGSNKVSGKVTYQGKTVPGGMVVFHGPNNWTGNSAIEQDGSYTIAKPPAGQVKITVDTSSMRPVQMPRNAPPMPNMSAAKDKMPANLPEAAKNNPLYNPSLNAGRYLAIPANYADAEKSGLTYEVTSGAQTHDIELK
jgi:hypothetical protein